MIVETFKVKVYLMVLRHFPAPSFCPVLVLAFAWQLFSSLHHFSGVGLYSNYNIGHQNFERVPHLILPTIWLNMFLLLYCVVNLISESASQGEGCCIIVRDQYLSWGSTAALNCFLTQKSVSRMTRGRSWKRYQTSRKSTDENDHYQTQQGEEIAISPAWCTSPRRGRPEDILQKWIQATQVMVDRILV